MRVPSPARPGPSPAPRSVLLLRLPVWLAPQDPADSDSVVLTALPPGGVGSPLDRASPAAPLSVDTCPVHFQKGLTGFKLDFRGREAPRVGRAPAPTVPPAARRVGGAGAQVRGHSGRVEGGWPGQSQPWPPSGHWRCGRRTAGRLPKHALTASGRTVQAWPRGARVSSGLVS